MSTSIDDPCDEDLVRVVVLAADRRLDLVLPSQLPMNALLPDLLDLLPTSDTGPHASTPARITTHQLSRPGGPPFSGGRSLHQHGVLDGDLLCWSATDEARPPGPPVWWWDVIAATGGSPPRRLDIRRLTWAVVAAILMSCGGPALTVGFAWRTGSATGVVAGLMCAGLLMFVCAARRRPGRPVAAVFATAGVAATSAAISAATESLPAADRLLPTAAGLLVGSLVALLVTRCAIALWTFGMVVGAALVISVLGGTVLVGHLRTAAGGAAGVHGARTAGGWPGVDFGIVASVGVAICCLLLTLLPAMAAGIARLRPARSPGLSPARRAAQGWTARDDSAGPPDHQRHQDELAARTRLALQVLIGLNAGTSTIIAGAAVVLIHRGGGWSPLLAGAGCGVLLLRAAVQSHAAQVAALALPAAAALLIGICRVVVEPAGPAATVATESLAIALAVVVVATVIALSGRRSHPEHPPTSGSTAPGSRSPNGAMPDSPMPDSPMPDPPMPDTPGPDTPWPASAGSPFAESTSSRRVVGVEARWTSAADAVLLAAVGPLAVLAAGALTVLQWR